MGVDREIVHRRAARILLLDSEDRVLLLEGVAYRQGQRYFTERTEPVAVVPAQLTRYELRGWRGHRWWRLDELVVAGAGASVRYYPQRLPELPRAMTAGSGEC